MGSLSLLMQLVIVAYLREMELIYLHAATFLYLLFTTFIFFLFPTGAPEDQGQHSPNPASTQGQAELGTSMVEEGLQRIPPS